VASVFDRNAVGGAIPVVREGRQGGCVHGVETVLMIAIRINNARED
jgi:hypothetical protein